MIIKTLNSNDFKKIHLFNRVQLIEDSMDFARNGELDYSVAFKIINYISREEEYLPWKTCLRNLGHINTMLKNYPLYGDYIVSSAKNKKL